VAEPLLGYIGEFGTPERPLDAATRARSDGFRCIDAFSPFPVEGMADVLALKRDHRIGWITLAGGLTGFFGMLAIQIFVNVDYPIEVGGRPIFAWPAFFVVDFELMILCAVTFAVAGMLIINRLPKLYHPLFSTPRFGLASENRFFLYIDASDPKFDAERTRTFLGSLGAWNVEPVRP
jgi:ActD protein